MVLQMFCIIVIISSLHSESSQEDVDIHFFFTDDDKRFNQKTFESGATWMEPVNNQNDEIELAKINQPIEKDQIALHSNRMLMSMLPQSDSSVNYGSEPVTTIQTSEQEALPVVPEDFGHIDNENSNLKVGDHILIFSKLRAVEKELRELKDGMRDPQKTNVNRNKSLKLEPPLDLNANKSGTQIIGLQGVQENERLINTHSNNLEKVSKTGSKPGTQMKEEESQTESFKEVFHKSDGNVITARGKIENTTKTDLLPKKKDQLKTGLKTVFTKLTELTKTEIKKG